MRDKAAQNLLVQTKKLRLLKGDLLAGLLGQVGEFLLHSARVGGYGNRFTVHRADVIDRTAEVGDAKAAKAEDQKPHKNPDKLV